MRKKRVNKDRNREYGVTLTDIAFGDVKFQLQFDDITETEDGWEPVVKNYGRVRCARMYERNSTMFLRKGVKLYR